ncbi:EexN family lipoprotein [Verminephrobacter aporrectodeae]|uniref:EexN family lipoprotein n=1 Tax=Verminephrobacter aporrectodeae TaxID=1110389 RepID=UPI002242DE7E|nr:EexN family lipoprotein [Verminephrobacter aporrectodeae]
MRNLGGFFARKNPPALERLSPLFSLNKLMIMISHTHFLLLVVAVTRAGCSGKDPVKTVDWYKENTPERLALVEKCRANPGELATSPNCINAITAANQITLDKRGYEKRTPINLSGSK